MEARNIRPCLHSFIYKCICAYAYMATIAS